MNVKVPDFNMKPLNFEKKVPDFNAKVGDFEIKVTNSSHQVTDFNIKAGNKLLSLSRFCLLSDKVPWTAAACCRFPPTQPAAAE